MSEREVRLLEDDDAAVLFRLDQEFTGMPMAWLVPRLRLDPAASPVDVSGGMVVYLDGDDIDIPDSSTIEDITDVLGSGPNDDASAWVDDGGVMGVRFSIHGGWLRDTSPEGPDWDTLTWVGAGIESRAVLMGALVDFMVEWGPDPDVPIHLGCTCLSVDDPDDVQAALSIAGDATDVSLNRTTLRSSEQRGKQG